MWVDQTRRNLETKGMRNIAPRFVRNKNTHYCCVETHDIFEFRKKKLASHEYSSAYIGLL